MDRSISRTGAWAGVVAVVGIFGYHLALMAIAGTRVSGTTDAAVIAAYYQGPEIAPLGIAGFLVVIPMAIFAVALREALSVSPWTRFLATIGLVAVISEIPVLVTSIAAQAALIETARANGDVLGLFRFWDALYNSGAYALEATWVGAFGLAIRDAAAFPHWLPRYSLLTAALLAINVSAIWIGIPDAATLPSALFLGLWFAATSLGLARTAATAPRVVGISPA
ncbi:MAG: hypothetical protein ABIP77_04150 [Candidatus Limnocylindrales bacterium]